MTKPTKPGWYWWRHDKYDDDRWRIVEVVFYGDDKKLWFYFTHFSRHPKPVGGDIEVGDEWGEEIPPRGE